MELTFPTALAIGFLGSTHCIGMCGGIVGALNAGVPDAGARSALSRGLHHIAYNGGRLASYAAAGALAGLIGAQAQFVAPGELLPVGGLIAGLFMIALGLYLAGWWRAIAGLESVGRYLWRWIQPLGRRFLPVRNPLHAFGLGLVWGWLPCGLVYSALALAVISASPARGAWLMLGFGLGTLPMLLVIGRTSEFLLALARSPAVRQVAGGLVVLFGVYTVFSVVAGRHGHAHHTSAAGGGATIPVLAMAQSTYSLVYDGICPSLDVDAD